jgi:hypothetical protein
MRLRLLCGPVSFEVPTREIDGERFAYGEAKMQLIDVQITPQQRIEYLLAEQMWRRIGSRSVPEAFTLACVDVGGVRFYVTFPDVRFGKHGDGLHGDKALWRSPHLVDVDLTYPAEQLSYVGEFQRYCLPHPSRHLLGKDGKASKAAESRS